MLFFIATRDPGGPAVDLTIRIVPDIIENKIRVTVVIG